MNSSLRIPHTLSLSVLFSWADEANLQKFDHAHYFELNHAHEEECLENSPEALTPHDPGSASQGRSA